MKLRTPIAIATAAVLLAAAQPATAERAGAPAFKPLSLCGTTCGAFSTTQGSTGLLRQSATGVTWGTVVGSSTIRVTPRGAARVTVSRWSARWRDGAATVYRGRGLTLLASGTWTVVVRGSDIRLRTVARGGAYVSGSGRYYLNGGRARAWTPAGKYLTLRK